ncbi:dihydroorotate dehydrogenase [Gaiella sp.]|uniref:dihydroorotate dehydrogenase n=1 Tax=Gaiella sp. TaxID=2663207 RepID=UPI0032649812
MSAPLLNGSGCLDALTAPDVAAQFDAFVTKTITPQSREGNPPVRIAETEAGMLNSIGLQGPGIEVFLADTLPRLAAQHLPIWVSVGGFSAADFGGICELLDGRRDIDVIELNLSCPNVDEAPESSAQIVAACRASTVKPLYAKLSPSLSDIAESARAVVAAGADGLTLVNTLRGMALDSATLRPKLARGFGGYSGPALKPVALACVSACARAVDVPIVGLGGVWSGQDALELIAAGASVVSLGTVLFSDPTAPNRIRMELEAESAARGYADPLDARGAANS